MDDAENLQQGGPNTWTQSILDGLLSIGKTAVGNLTNQNQPAVTQPVAQPAANQLPAWLNAKNVLIGAVVVVVAIVAVKKL